MYKNAKNLTIYISKDAEMKLQKIVLKRKLEKIEKDIPKTDPPPSTNSGVIEEAICLLDKTLKGGSVS